MNLSYLLGFKYVGVNSQMMAYEREYVGVNGAYLCYTHCVAQMLAL
jgi:hypothetical protein